MAIIYNGKKYSSKKHPLLEYIFNIKTNNGETNIKENITFTLKDISNAYKACEMDEPASISNTILDLTRQDRGISSRLPQYIIDFGYDLRKKTGPSSDGNYAGEFVYVGNGNYLNSWLIWPETPDKIVSINNLIPTEIETFLSNDEGALFSVIDYCDALSYAIHNEANTIVRVQNPMKWQPNEIDGLYYCKSTNTLIPIEAKAISTGDSINLEQMLGQYHTIIKKFPSAIIKPAAAQMINNGINLALLCEQNNQLKIDTFIKITFTPEIKSWLK